jgi:hypothetical protein
MSMVRIQRRWIRAGRDGLRAKGMLTDDEFASKKAELLARF